MEIDKQKRDKAMKRGTFFGFIPYRLEIAWQPEWHNFPFNVLFVSQTVRDGKLVTGTALYEPDFYTYRKEGDLSLMRYHNIYGGDCYLTMGYDEKKKRYFGQKYVNGELVGDTDGDDWRLFFTHLTMLGLTAGEKCKFETEELN
jgi:hypothetical protein